MRSIKTKDTRPELIVRRHLHALGYRFRLHRADLPGTPDVVLPKHRAAIFINGCYWHQHSCRLGKKPRTNLAYWIPKLERNVARDKGNRSALRTSGWHVLTIWECTVLDGTYKTKPHGFLPPQH